VSWRCGVCDGVNQDGETCAICGASRAAAVPVDPPVTRPAPPPPTRAPEETPPSGRRRPPLPDTAPPVEPEPPRGLLRRLVDRGVRAIERAIALPPPAPEPELEPEPTEPRPRRRSRMKVRPFPFGIMVTWEDHPDDESS